MAKSFNHPNLQKTLKPLKIKNNQFQTNNNKSINKRKRKSKTIKSLKTPKFQKSPKVKFSKNKRIFL